ncbi:MAG TPA: acyl carrier protein [Jatrophihabitans sp.]|jgi:act minimal PKS acyl carrier protein|nr:acyl carrier protein [Jatrophihabitans sp.]
MQKRTFDLSDLSRILRVAAGSKTEIVAELANERFEDLGYDSLALLETSGRIEREYDIALEDSTISDAYTPALLVETVNRQLAAVYAS